MFLHPLCNSAGFKWLRLNRTLLNNRQSAIFESWLWHGDHWRALFSSAGTLPVCCEPLPGALAVCQRGAEIHVFTGSCQLCKFIFLISWGYRLLLKGQQHNLPVFVRTKSHEILVLLEFPRRNCHAAMCVPFHPGVRLSVFTHQLLLLPVCAVSSLACVCRCLANASWTGKKRRHSMKRREHGHRSIGAPPSKDKPSSTFSPRREEFFFFFSFKQFILHSGAGCLQCDFRCATRIPNCWAPRACAC